MKIEEAESLFSNEGTFMCHREYLHCLTKVSSSSHEGIFLKTRVSDRWLDNKNGHSKCPVESTQSEQLTTRTLFNKRRFPPVRLILPPASSPYIPFNIYMREEAMDVIFLTIPYNIYQNLAPDYHSASRHVKYKQNINS